MAWNDLIGTPFGDGDTTYQIEAEIARGGMSRVYRAHDMRDDRDVALKVMALGGDSSDGPTFTKRFEHEAHAVELLDHPNIVKVYATGRTDEFVYIAMQLVLGGTFRQRLGRPMPVADACFQMIQMAKALHHAHMHQVIHRDVKPANMLIDDQDPSHLLLADFGIAKIMGQKGVTKTGTAVGTPEYMAPEQAKGEEIDPRADIYGLACVLYEALAGRPPFVGPTALSICYQHVHTRPAYIRGFNPEVPRPLALVIEQALAKNPRDRFSTAEDFANALYPFTDSGGRVAAVAITGGLDLRATPAPDVRVDAVEGDGVADAEPAAVASPAPVESAVRVGEAAAMLDLSSLGTRPAPTPLGPEEDTTTQQTQELAPIAPIARPRHTRPVQPPGVHLKSRPLTRPREGGALTPSGNLVAEDVAHLSTVQTPITPPMTEHIASAPPPTLPTRATTILGTPPSPSRLRLIAVIAAALLVGVLTLLLVAHTHSASSPNSSLVSTTGAAATAQPTVPPAATPSVIPSAQPTAHPSPQPSSTSAPAVKASDVIYAATTTAQADTTCDGSKNQKSFTAGTRVYINTCVNPGYGAGTILDVLSLNGGQFISLKYAAPNVTSQEGFYQYYDESLPTGSYTVEVQWNGSTAQTLTFTVK